MSWPNAARAGDIMTNFQGWKKYESAERWASYYTQVDEVLAFAPATCLEIGVGNGIVTHALKKQGIAVTTMDLDPGLSPDLVGSVESIAANDAQFDVVLCAEVLEHLPFEKFDACIAGIARVARVGAVISVPHWGYTVRCILDLPGLPSMRKAWKLPIHIEHVPGGEHFWEIGKRGYPLERIVGVLSRYFEVERTFLLPWMPYHQFFRLKKRN